MPPTSMPNFVAMVTLPRSTVRRNAPNSASAIPSPYMRAVSKWVIPLSTALPRTAIRSLRDGDCIKPPHPKPTALIVSCGPGSSTRPNTAALADQPEVRSDELAATRRKKRGPPAPPVGHRILRRSSTCSTCRSPSSSRIHSVGYEQTLIRCNLSRTRNKKAAAQIVARQQELHQRASTGGEFTLSVLRAITWRACARSRTPAESATPVVE